MNRRLQNTERLANHLVGTRHNNNKKIAQAGRFYIYEGTSDVITVYSFTLM